MNNTQLYNHNQGDKYKRWIKEAIWIKRKTPMMKRDEGAYHLSNLWTGLITTTPPSGKKVVLKMAADNVRNVNNW